MQHASPEQAGLEVQGRRGDGPHESGKRGPSRLAGLERERAAKEMFARVAAHELMATLIASETRARLLEDQLHNRDDGRAGADLQDLIRVLSRMRQLVETLLHDARSSGVPLERKAVTSSSS
jgi:light-regulated signal transduction histidine kinase (bacteriophytochrome)